MKKIIPTIATAIKRCFYKIEWMPGTKERNEEEDYDFYDGRGYYLTKRKWMWWLFFPVIFFFLCLYQIFVFIDLTNSYQSQWIGSEEEKLTRKQYTSIFNHLSS